MKLTINLPDDVAEYVAQVKKAKGIPKARTIADAIRAQMAKEKGKK